MLALLLKTFCYLICPYLLVTLGITWNRVSPYRFDVCLAPLTSQPTGAYPCRCRLVAINVCLAIVASIDMANGWHCHAGVCNGTFAPLILAYSTATCFGPKLLAHVCCVHNKEHYMVCIEKWWTKSFYSCDGAIMSLRLLPATDWYVRLATSPTTKQLQVDRNLEPFDRTTLST